MAHAHSANALALVTARKEWHMLLLSRQLLVWRHYEWTLNAEQHVKHLLLLLVAVVLLLRKRGLEFVAKDQLWVLLRRGLRDGCASILRFRYIPFLNGELEKMSVHTLVLGIVPGLVMRVLSIEINNSEENE